MKQIKFLIVVVVFLCLTGCNGCNKNKSREKPDVSGINLELKVLRFDQDLLGVKTQDYGQWRQMMLDKYHEFYRFYISNFVIGPRPAGDTADIEQMALHKFLDDKYIATIQDSINSRFPDTKQTEADLTKAMKYFTHYFPEFKAPQIITINSAYGAGVSPFGNERLVIGLDMFLGADNKDYDSAGVYMYLRHKMRPEYIVRYATEALYEENYGDINTPADQPLIEAMIDRGKKLYFLSYILPDAPDSMLLGYTQKQTDWCNENEYGVWQFLNNKDLLYKNSGMDKTRYLGEGPTTSGMPPEAPGSIGSYIGLQIVRKFMDETGNKITLRDLVQKYDAKTILEKAKYRPAK